MIFSCDAVGYPVPTFLWTKDGFAVNTDDHRISLSENNTHLIITNVNRKDRGEYRCEAHNIVNTVKSNAAMLTVQRKGILYYSISIQLITCVPVPSLDNFGYFFLSTLANMPEKSLLVLFSKSSCKPIVSKSCHDSFSQVAQEYIFCKLSDKEIHLQVTHLLFFELSAYESNYKGSGLKVRLIFPSIAKQFGRP